ncbi:hypothetical protein A2397_01955 [Candidatus Amesbacteria bacterium RIFOXYB1_FULL_44_23]|uniref:Vitamin K epoxide reductase domain-containing protein n=1 Tax=Candidatus Amesbacteria bacterium RIFOXYB1_FULL_44_23 TaxID=1797263 RepID=A0A1F4ZSR5_9BACT|nr:MAG: hypothetical protein A2397_01955 [Candidatus Amesbacteria bacterium RIFOXYB1_FULL_44_23]
MTKLARLCFICLLAFSLYHLGRDILQTLNLNNGLTDILHRPHNWCKPYCNLVTFPLDVTGIAGGFVVLKRGYIGLLGKLSLTAIPLWLVAYFLP